MPLMTKVSPFSAPNYDVFSPARRSDERGIVMGAQLDGNQAYIPWIGLSTVRELALKHADRVGLVEIERLEEAKDQRDTLAAEAASLRAQVAALEVKQERIIGLAGDGFRVVKAAGRPPKEKAAA